jgi:hypothetical protein
VTEIHSPRLLIASPTRWALTSGISGFVVDVLLVLEQLTERPERYQYLMWLPAAIAWVMVVEFLTLIPVALALRGWLPPTRSLRLATAAAVGAMLAITTLQLLLLTSALEFDLQVVLVMAAFLLVSTWVLTVSSTGHRRGTLRQPISRFQAHARGVISGGPGHCRGRTIIPFGICCLAHLCHTRRRTPGHRVVGPSGVAVGSGPPGLQQAPSRSSTRKEPS